MKTRTSKQLPKATDGDRLLEQLRAIDEAVAADVIDLREAHRLETEVMARYPMPTLVRELGARLVA